MEFLEIIKKHIESLSLETISTERKEVLEPVIDYVSHSLKNNGKCNLNFICTHNSRRSQFSEVWAKVMADFYGFPHVFTFSGGVEVTAFNERAIDSLKRTGFEINILEGTNPVVEVKYADTEPLKMFSKLYDDKSNPTEKFAAVMTCDHADENCPFIPGTEKRISLTYVDPKAFDDTPKETTKYDERSLQIATEMKYIFSSLKENQS